MSKNPFNERRNYVWGFLFAAVFVSILVVDVVTNGITNNIIDGFKNGCYMTFKDTPVNLERCLAKSEESRSLTILNKAICSSCEKGGLCLQGADLQYCEQSFDKNVGLIGLRSAIKSITTPFVNLDTNAKLAIIVILFGIGFFIKKKRGDKKWFGG